MSVKRKQIPHVWVAEVAYKESRWITLWTTCRLTRAEAQVALSKHPTMLDYCVNRIVKFERAK